MYSILKLKQDISGVIHGTTLNKIQNLYGIINRSARDVLRDVDPMETQRIAMFGTPVFEDVYSYALADDVKGNAIIDIRPQTNRWRIYNQDYSQQFDLSKTQSLQDQFHIQWNSGVRTILLNSPLLNTGVDVNNLSSLTGNGTFTATDDATDLKVNTNNYIAGGGAIGFNLSGATTTGGTQTINMDSVDLSAYLNQSYLFLSIYLPDNGFTGVTLSFGSSSADYYTASATTSQAGTAFASGWQQVSFDWNNLSEIGTPDSSNVTFVKVSLTYDGNPKTGILVNNLTCLTGQIMEYVYYSKYLFRDATTNVFQEEVTDDSNLINLDTDSYNLLFNKVAYYVAQQLQGSNALYDASFFGGDDGNSGEYGKALKAYKAHYKSERQKPQQRYYQINNKRTDRYLR